ncbi:MAG: Crp/Fnr family transcriptional regulator [Clostridium sp.]|nr:Crp/Fnr family transcriptional regulator [Clostridium sp.]
MTGRHVSIGNPLTMEDQTQTITRQLAALFGRVTAEEERVLSSLLECRRVKKRERVVGEGQVCRHLVFVRSGLLRQYYYKNGREITEHFTIEGQFAYCVESVFRCKPSALVMEALEPCELWLLPYGRLVDAGRAHAGLADWLRCFLEENLILHQRKADSWRFESVTERYGRFLREFPTVACRASVNDIASYLLMTPESLSRVRSQAHRNKDGQAAE